LNSAQSQPPTAKRKKNVPLRQHGFRSVKKLGGSGVCPRGAAVLLRVVLAQKTIKKRTELPPSELSLPEKWKLIRFLQAKGFENDMVFDRVSDQD